MLDGHYYNGYVTHDLEKALEMFAARFGIRDFKVGEHTFTLRTPQGEATSQVKVALRPGIELVEPVAGFQDQITPFLPRDRSDPSPRLNHIALRRDSIAVAYAEIKKMGLPFTLETGLGPIMAIYVDARASLGHYIEYVCALTGSKSP